MRIGIERQLASGHVLRAGYDYHPNPARRSAMTPLIPVVLEHTFALGYSMPLGHWTLALAGQLSCGPSTHVRRSRIVGGEFDDSTLDGYALGFFVGFTYGFD